MTRDQFLDALQAADDRYLTEASCLLGYDETPTRRRPLRRMLIAAAVAAALLLAAFTAAMAASEPFRSGVYRVFHIQTRERVPAPTKLPKDAEKVVPLAHITLDNAAQIDRYSVQVPVRLLHDGSVYAPEKENGHIYRFHAGAVETIPTTHREIETTFRGVTFEIAYDYARCADGYVLASWENPRMNENPYGYASELTLADAQSGKAWLELPDWDADYALYPMLLDLESGTVTDVLDGMDVTLPEDAYPLTWRYSPNLRWLLELDGNHGRAWLYDLQTRTRMDEQQLFGAPVVLACFDGADTLVGLEHTETVLRATRYSLRDGTREVVDMSQYAGHFGDGIYTLAKDFLSPHYWTVGDGSGHTKLLNVRTGAAYDWPDEAAGMPLNAYESPDGRRIAFVHYDYEQSGVDTTKNVFDLLAVLDVETGEYTILDRERSTLAAAEETAFGWIDADSFMLLTEAVDGRVNVTVYTLRAPE